MVFFHTSVCLNELNLIIMLRGIKMLDIIYIANVDKTW